MPDKYNIKTEIRCNNNVLMKKVSISEKLFSRHTELTDGMISSTSVTSVVQRGVTQENKIKTPDPRK